MATLVIRVPKCVEDFQQMLVKCGISHLHSIRHQEIIGERLVKNRFFFEKNECIQADNGCKATIVNVIGTKLSDHYYIYIANNTLSKVEMMLMYEKLHSYMPVNPIKEIDDYKQLSILHGNDLYEHSN